MRTGLVAFGITTAVLVPAALERLTAGSAEVARLAAPGARTVEVGGATIDVALDRAIVDPGQQVHLTLTARAAAAREVKLAVLVMEAQGSGGGRVDTPAQRVARQTVTFPAGATGATRTLAFTLRGRRGLEMEGIAPFGRYTILVMPPATADRLERLRRGALRVDEPMEDPDGTFGAWSNAYDAIGRDVDVDADRGDPDEAALADLIGAPGATARLEVATRPTGSPIAIRTPATATAGAPFPVVVTVRNPGRTAVRGVGVRLGAPPLYGLDYRGLPAEQLAFAPATATIDLGPREAKEVVFQVTALGPGTAGLHASTTCDDADDWDACQPLLDGALDATAIVAPAEPAAPTTVAALPR